MAAGGEGLEVAAHAGKHRHEEDARQGRSKGSELLSVIGSNTKNGNVYPFSTVFFMFAFENGNERTYALSVIAGNHMKSTVVSQAVNMPNLIALPKAEKGSNAQREVPWASEHSSTSVTEQLESRRPGQAVAGESKATRQLSQCKLAPFVWMGYV